LIFIAFSQLFIIHTENSAFANQITLSNYNILIKMCRPNKSAKSNQSNNSSSRSEHTVGANAPSPNLPLVTMNIKDITSADDLKLCNLVILVCIIPFHRQADISMFSGESKVVTRNCWKLIFVSQ
jgi:hypothetical protein